MLRAFWVNNASVIVRSVYIYLLILPMIANASEQSVTWVSTYYQAMPNQKNVSAEYCRLHEIGTFVGNVQDQLEHGAVTNRGIHLSHFVFRSKQKNGVFFLEGSLIAEGIIHKTRWRDHINYHLYKLTKYGSTFGVWTSEKCKGLYKGDRIS